MQMLVWAISQRGTDQIGAAVERRMETFRVQPYECNHLLVAADELIHDHKISANVRQNPHAHYERPNRIQEQEAARNHHAGYLGASADNLSSGYFVLARIAGLGLFFVPMAKKKELTVREFASMGGKALAAKRTKAERSAAAIHANKIRWAREREARTA